MVLHRALTLALTFALMGCPTRGTLVPGGSGNGDGGVEPPVDVNLGPPCAPIVEAPRTDPCPGRPSCGLPSQAHVSVTGAHSVLPEFQVRVTLPATVLAAVGPACDRMVFRTAANVWAPHFVVDCAMGAVWVRVPEIQPAGTTLTLYYGGATAPAGASSYDDTFDRVPKRAPNLLAAYTFDEGAGTRTCPLVGTFAFDAYVSDYPFAQSAGHVRVPPALWSPDSPPAMLAPTNPAARFRRHQTSLNLPRLDFIEHVATPPVSRVDRMVNWRSSVNAPFKMYGSTFTVGIWVYTESPANEFLDNFQTVIGAGMPENPTPPYPGAQFHGASIFNPWAIFFRSDGPDNSYLQGNTCVYPCLTVDEYAHVTTRAPFTREQIVHRWHFVALSLDVTTHPHATRRSYYEDQVYEYPQDLDRWPEQTYCDDAGVCVWPPDTAIQTYEAPVVIGADMNGGYTALNLEGKVDDLFVVNRAVPPEEMRAYRERRAYSPDAITATVTP